MSLRIIQYITSVIITYLLTSIYMHTSDQHHSHFIYLLLLNIPLIKYSM